MLQEIYAMLKERGLLKWVFVGIGLILTIALLSVLLGTNYSRHTISATPFNTSGGAAYLNGSDIYSYNGAAFYKTNIESPGQVTLLSSGVKLPVVSTVAWANDNGALVNFKESFILTEVESALQKSGKELSEATMASTWYFEFASGSLHPVHDKPLIGGLTLFSSEQNGFYYIPDLFFTPLSEAGDDFPDYVSLHFYDIGSKEDGVVIKDLNLVDISRIEPCYDQKYRVCLVARDEDKLDNTGVFAITQDNQSELLLESDGRLIPTNKPELFITTAAIPLEEYFDEEVAEYDVPVDIPPSAAVLNNLADGTTTDLGFDIAGEAVVPHFTSLEDFYILESESASLDDSSVYRSGATSIFGNVTTKQFSLQFRDNTYYTDGLSDRAYYGDDGIVMVTSAKGEYFLFSPQQASLDSDILSLAVSEAEETVKRCVDSSAVSYQYSDEDKLFKVFFTHNKRMSGNIATFTDCLAEDNSNVFVGYSFYFGGLDPDNGRIVTD